MSGSGSPIYDRATALARLGGDESLFAEMVVMFLAERENYCRALGDALASGDAVVLRREAHTVKSLLATFASATGSELALRLEQQAAVGDLSGAEDLVTGVLAALRQLAGALAAQTQ